MAAKAGVAYVDVQGDFTSLNRALSSRNSPLSKKFAKFGKGIGAGLALGVGAVVVEGSRAVKAYEETRKVAAQTNAVIRSTGKAANLTAGQMADLATQISRKTGVDDEAVQSAENLLATFTKVRNETGKGNDVFTQSTKIITDMSVALGQDMKSSAIQVGKALNDPIKGVTALQRVGVSFTAKQREQIKTLETTGHHLEAQKIILRELNTEFKGSAAAQATPLDKAKVAAGNLEEALGGGLRPAIDSVAREFTKLATLAEPELNRLTKQVSKTFERDDLDLGEKFRKAFDLTKTQIRFGPTANRLESEFRKSGIAAKLGDVADDAFPIIANHAATSAPRIASAFIHGFLDSNSWGRLATAGFLLAKMGGPPAFLKLGTQAGNNMGTGMATGVATSGLKGRLGATFKAWGPTLGLTLAAAFGPEIAKGVGQSLQRATPKFNLPKNPRGSLFGLDFETSFTFLSKKFSQGEQGLRTFGDTAEREFRRAAKAKDAVRLESLADQARKFAGQFPQYGAQLNRFATAADQAARDAGGSFRDLSRLGGRSMQKIKTATEDTAFAIKNTLGRDTRAGKRALANNFAGAAAAIQKSMDAGKISVKDGTAQINKYMLLALQNVGFSREEAIKVRRGQDPLSGANTRPKGGGKQRGGPINNGAPVGDTVPAMLERGEYVLNRKAVRKVGRGTLDRINFGAAPRFQKGGIVELLDPFNDPAGHGGKNSHLHVAMRTVQQIVALGRQLQKKGWLISENPAFGGVHPVHAPNSYHYKGLAIDANWPDPGQEAAKIRALLPLLESGKVGALSGVVPKLRRVLVDGPSSALKGVVQGALDLSLAASQDRLNKAGLPQFEGAEPGIGGSASGNGADLMRRISKSRGWNFADWWALDDSETSHGRNLSNPTSTARLRGQFLSSNYGKYGPGSDPAQHPSMGQQIQSMAQYIASRYGNPTKAWAFHQAHNWYSRGGLVGMQAGGLAGQLDQTLGKIGKARTTKGRNNAVAKMLDSIKGVGLPGDVERNLKQLAGDATKFGDYADRAGQLNTDDGTSLGTVNGRNQLQWLTEQLGALFRWRNQIIDAEKIVEQRREEIRQLIEQARARLASVQTEIAAAAGVRKGLKGRLATIGGQISRLRKNPRRNAGRIASLLAQKAAIGGTIRGIDGEQKSRQRVKTALSSKILPGLTGRRSALNTARGDLLSSLEDVQGVGSPMERLGTLPALGVMGGQIFGVQMNIRSLTDNPASVTDSSSAASERADTLAQLLREANLRTAVSESQFQVFKNFPPYGGSFATGGPVPGPLGAPRTIIAHGGETVVPAGEGPNVRVVVEDQRIRVYVNEIEQVVERVTRRQARSGARVLPGRGGGLG